LDILNKLAQWSYNTGLVISFPPLYFGFLGFGLPFGKQST